MGPPALSLCKVTIFFFVVNKSNRDVNKVINILCAVRPHRFFFSSPRSPHEKMSSSQDTGRQVKEVNYSYSLARPRISQSEPEYSGDAVQVLALPPHRPASVS